jgi:2-polyprenyl-3-methyl-5-hydroxy-6-metoxy-1,4-benzoquinol methylase
LKYVGQELETFRNAVNWRKYWSKIIESEIKGNVLEVGSGMGTVTDELKNSNFESWVSIEPDFSLLSMTNSTIREKVELINGTSSSIKGKEHFDTILYIDVLEHIENDITELQVINRTLKLGGSVIILSPAFNYLFNDFDKSVGHYRRYDKQSLINLLPEGFTIKKIAYLDTLGFTLAVFNRFIFKKSTPTNFQIKFWDRFLIPISKLVDVLTLNYVGKSIIMIATKSGISSS